MRRALPDILVLGLAVLLGALAAIAFTAPDNEADASGGDEHAIITGTKDGGVVIAEVAVAE